MMAVMFDYTAQLRNGYLLISASSSGTYRSENTTAAGTFFEAFRCLYNPGHQNSCTAFEYFLRPYVAVMASSYKWDFKMRGSTVWNTFTTGYMTAASYAINTGTYDTSAVALPVEFRLMSKTSFAGGYMQISNETSNMCVVRSWGLVAT